MESNKIVQLIAGLIGAAQIAIISHLGEGLKSEQLFMLIMLAVFPYLKDVVAKDAMKRK